MKLVVHATQVKKHCILLNKIQMIYRDSFESERITQSVMNYMTQ